MPDGSIDPKVDYIAQLSDESGVKWPTIAIANADAVEVQRLLCDKLSQFSSDDVDFVVFGSLARREWTSGSDVDWTMLVDGQANADHRKTAREINRTLGEVKFHGTKLKPPGTEATFGNMAFSHEIVHRIGGQADTNSNTTQRILFLMEATALREPGDEFGPFERIVRQILNRYLVSDSNFHSQNDIESRIPRFLLNDIVRYWRTLCVDFAYKDWEQGGKKWALRNIKLRTSRKLLFVSGLLTVFSCFQNESLQRHDDENSYMLKLQEHLMNFVHSTPLNIFIWTMQQLELDKQCQEFVNDYEKFLLLMDDKAIRNHLSELSEENVYDDEKFIDCQKISHSLQKTLTEICFRIKSPLSEFTFGYGLF